MMLLDRLNRTETRELGRQFDLALPGVGIFGEQRRLPAIADPAPIAP
jgi:hypothetical protein